MEVSKKQLPKSQIQITVSLESQEFEKYREEVVAALAKEVKLEGFRPGHVPSAVAEKHLREADILAELARVAIQNAYREIVAENNLDVIGEPEVQVSKLASGNPLEFQITVATIPEVQLPEYKEVAKKSKKRQVAVSEKEVDEALEWLRKSRKSPSQTGEHEESTDEEPEMNDDFAKAIGNFPDIAALKISISEGLQQEKEMQEKDRLRQEILENIAEESKLEMPDLLIEREKRVLLQNIKQGVAQMSDTSFEQYLEQSGKTEQELLDSFAEEAEKRVKRFLVVREIARKEEINATPEEIEQESNNILQHCESAGKAQKAIDPARLKEYTEGVIRHEKTLQFLEESTIA